MSRLKILVIVPVLLCMALIALAQDTLEPANVCSEDDQQSFFEALSRRIETPAVSYLQWLKTVEITIAAERWKCSDMMLSGDGDAVLGAISIPDNVYRVRLTTDEAFTLETKAANGFCDLRISIGEGKASAGYDAVLEADYSCLAVFEVRTDGNWQLQFMPLG